jgi:hypothetical protein
VPVALFVKAAKGIPQAAVAAGGLTKFQGQLGEQILLLQITAGAGNLAAEHFRKGEVLQQRYEVCEGFVERQRVRMGGIDVATMDAIKDCVGCFVCDDVVAKAGEDR